MDYMNLEKNKMLTIIEFKSRLISIQIDLVDNAHLRQVYNFTSKNRARYACKCFVYEKKQL